MVAGYTGLDAIQPRAGLDAKMARYTLWNVPVSGLLGSAGGQPTEGCDAAETSENSNLCHPSAFPQKFRGILQVTGKGPGLEGPSYQMSRW